MSKMPEPKFLNHYRCPKCGHEWHDEWECQVDDDCPACGTRHITPYDSEDLPEEECEIERSKP